MKLGVMGARGSFSEEAGKVYAKKWLKNKRFTIDYLVTAENVLSAIEKGGVEIGIFPIENSNGGIVIEAVYAMAKHRFAIQKIFEIEVHHSLLVKKGTSANRITKIVSHDQALKQCRTYLKRRWPEVQLEEYRDTAQAAHDLARGILPANAAVVASSGAAKLYKLDILEDSIQDLKFNYTSFIAAERLAE